MEGQPMDRSTGMPISPPSMARTKTEPESSDGTDFVYNRPPSTSQMDKDFLCPICMQRMKDAFLTSCGHSFCYSCVTTHLGNRQNCPSCGQYLTHDQLFPNFLLNKLLMKAAASHLVSNASPAEHLRLALKQGAEVSVKELDSLMVLIAEKKRKAEQEEAEVNMEILLDFLHRSAQQKQEELKELQQDLQYLEEDISQIGSKRKDISNLREQTSARLRMLLQEPQASQDLLRVEQLVSVSSMDRIAQGEAGDSSSRRRLQSSGWQNESGRRDPSSIADDSNPTTMTGNAAASAMKLAKKRRVFSQFEDLQECYLQRRRKMANPNNTMHKVGRGGGEVVKNGLDEFQTILRAFTKYSRLKVVAELRHGDLFHTSNIVSSIEFDRDDELFATAGVSRRIKVFEYATVVNELADVHCPVVEMSTRSKLSCLSWNKYIKAHIASSDYEGIVTVWDVNTCQSVMEYEEHEKRAWSVDFSRTEPTRLVSGSDDGKVKIWCTRQESSVVNIDMKANICCVKFNPGSSTYVAVGSADHHIHYYDIRNTATPLHVFSGHRKAVSYVKFISPTELASASTDSTLRLWDVSENCLLRTLKGHSNEKNFVGLSVNSDYIACGSETNEVYVYYKAMSKPAAVHKFGSPESLTGEESDDDTSHFISAVCWKSDSPTMLAANSQGTIKVLTLAP